MCIFCARFAQIFARLGVADIATFTGLFSALASMSVIMHTFLQTRTYISLSRQNHRKYPDIAYVYHRDAEAHLTPASQNIIRP